MCGGCRTGWVFTRGSFRCRSTAYPWP
ncbi:hypothetical protein D8771_19305 [Streptomyces albus]|uniref:Uncharacterized protein n=1 Tax=Streptomyces albus TaxID=1888 RepID=A0A8H1LC54_9ACTN|nr:hypothetical protein D8771_19305 [Streptomyces albus]